jgi:hypothetical protein
MRGQTVRLDDLFRRQSGATIWAAAFFVFLYRRIFCEYSCQAPSTVSGSRFMVSGSRQGGTHDSGFRGGGARDADEGLTRSGHGHGKEME